ncbi:MAG: GAF domain-containing protein [Chloroflexi bacterium]|nr:GAF domain-containing protein [Chloroflexota bacterium]
MLDALPEPVLVFDLAGKRFVLANQAATHLLGYAQDELLERSPVDVLDAAEAARFALALEHVAPGTVTRREWTARTSDGRLLPVGVTSVPVVLAGRAVIEMIVHDRSDGAPDAAQERLLTLAHDRLAATVDRDETIAAITALLVPELADRCTIDLVDEDGQQARVADTGQETAGVGVDAGSVGPVTAEGPGGADPAVREFRLRAHGRELGVLTLSLAAPRRWTADACSVATALARRAAQALNTARLWRTAQRELEHRAAMHRITRAFADSDPGSDRAMEVMLQEALSLLGGDHGGIALWDAGHGRLIQVYSNTGRSNGVLVGLDDSLSGAAARTKHAIISNAYQEEYGKATPAGKFGARASIAAPLLHEGRLIGVLSVGTRREGKRFTRADAEALDLLAGMAAAMLGTLERAQLQAVTLAARELAHRLNNDLALAVGTIDLLRGEPSLPADLHEMVEEAEVGLRRIAEQLRQLQQLVRFQTRETPVGPALDLDRSTAPEELRPG